MYKTQVQEVKNVALKMLVCLNITLEEQIEKFERSVDEYEQNKRNFEDQNWIEHVESHKSLVTLERLIMFIEVWLPKLPDLETH